MFDDDVLVVYWHKSVFLVGNFGRSLAGAIGWIDTLVISVTWSNLLTLRSLNSRDSVSLSIHSTLLCFVGCVAHPQIRDCRTPDPG